MSLDWEAIMLDEGSVTRTPCDCCRATTTSVEGDIEGPDGWIGFYTVRFSAGHLDRVVIFQVFTGDWSEGASSSNRWCFWAEFSLEQQGFCVLDPVDDEQPKSFTALKRADIIGSPFAPEAFAMLDAIYMKDSRLEPIRS
ncbi:MAG: hypothetical protein AAFR53_02590 [Pseudomonadota bacterium]